MTVIAGNYTLTWNSLALGQLSDGIEHDGPGIGEFDPIQGDNFGPQAIQDGVTQGGNMFVRCLVMEYNAAAIQRIIEPGSAGTPGYAVQPGLLLSAFAAALVATKVSGTNAVPATSRTYTYAVPQANQRTQYALAHRKRYIPLQFLILPYMIGGTTRGYFVDV